VVRVTSRPRFTPGETAPGTHWTGVRVGLRGCLDTEARGKNLLAFVGDPTSIARSSSQEGSHY
jgi:hypothetical protein